MAGRHIRPPHLSIMVRCTAASAPARQHAATRPSAIPCSEDEGTVLEKGSVVGTGVVRAASAYDGEEATGRAGAVTHECTSTGQQLSL
jgi:hypothetical protein